MINEENEEVDKTFAEFCAGFLAKHAVKGPGSGNVTVIVTKDDLMNLTRGWVQLFVGWGAGLEVSRAERGETLSPERLDPVIVDTRREERPHLTLVRQSKPVE
jgi:hypothetical protein